jgi:hypothetical protein
VAELLLEALMVSVAAVVLGYPFTHLRRILNGESGACDFPSGVDVRCFGRH